MMTLYQDRPSTQYRGFLIAAIIILFILGKTNITYPLNVAFRTILFPLLQGSKYSQSLLQNEVATFTQLRAQRAQIQELQEENTRLTAENAFLKVLREEQKSWYSQQKIAPRSEFIPVPAIITSSQDIITVTVKSNTPIKENYVITAQDHAVALVEKVEETTVTGIPLAYLNRELPVIIVGKEGVKGRGLLGHSFGTSLEVRRVLQDIPVTEGDQIMLLPEDPWPDTIKVGDVSEVIKRESDVFQILKVRQPIDVSRLINVVIYAKP